MSDVSMTDLVNFNEGGTTILMSDGNIQIAELQDELHESKNDVTQVDPGVHIAMFQRNQHFHVRVQEHPRRAREAVFQVAHDSSAPMETPLVVVYGRLTSTTSSAWRYENGTSRIESQMKLERHSTHDDWKPTIQSRQRRSKITTATTSERICSGSSIRVDNADLATRDEGPRQNRGMCERSETSQPAHVAENQTLFQPSKKTNIGY